MLFKYKKNLKSSSRKLRHETTDAERLLWRKIRCKQLSGYQFNRQKPIDNFIVDFYCCRAMLAIEIDGGQHYEEEYQKKDKLRDDRLKQLGIKVLRFTNLDVLKNIDGVVMRIEEELNPSQPPFKKGGED
ncbi:endonuclease domain-containing protein [Patescibacteria group bacterium]|nr:endonuclease domain-containing protein [Patescibacteria group bacterium]MBU2264979.1 endonuclease domain-containing protein [Patescibacteria group bacterium]